MTERNDVAEFSSSAPCCPDDDEDENDGYSNYDDDGVTRWNSGTLNFCSITIETLLIGWRSLSLILTVLTSVPSLSGQESRWESLPMSRPIITYRLS